MGWFHDSIIARGLLALCVFALILLLADSYYCDQRSIDELKYNTDIWDVPTLDDHQQSVINKMIDNYFKRRSLNKSKYKKMISAAKDGIFHGAIGGCITGGPAGAIPGAIVYGVMGAVSCGIKRRIPSNDVILEDIDKF